MSRATESRTATAYARTARAPTPYLGLATASEHLAAELERAGTESAAPVEVLGRLLAAEVEATSARRDCRGGSASPTTRSTSASASSSSTSSPASTGRGTNRRRTRGALGPRDQEGGGLFCCCASCFWTSSIDLVLTVLPGAPDHDQAHDPRPDKRYHQAD